MTVYISNSDSTKIWPDCFRQQREITPEHARDMLLSGDGNFVSAIGHPDTARIVSEQLGIDIPAQRIDLFIDDVDDYLIVAEYTGRRLEPGMTELPSGATIRYVMLSIDRF